MGRKEYKVGLKGYGSLGKLLARHSDMFTVDIKGGTVVVIEGADPNPNPNTDTDTDTSTDANTDGGAAGAGAEAEATAAAAAAKKPLLDSGTANTFNQALESSGVEFECGDIFTAEWLSGEAMAKPCVVYVASLLFSAAMMDQLSEQASVKLVPGSRLVSLKPITTSHASSCFELKYRGFFDMSWKKAEVFVYVRI